MAALAAFVRGIPIASKMLARPGGLADAKFFARYQPLKRWKSGQSAEYVALK